VLSLSLQLELPCPLQANVLDRPVLVEGIAARARR